MGIVFFEIKTIVKGGMKKMKVRKEQSWKRELSTHMSAFEKRFLKALKAGFTEQDKRIDKKFTEKFAEQDRRIDLKFTEQDRRIDLKFAVQDKRFEVQDNKIDQLSSKIDKVDNKVDKLAHLVVTHFATKDELDRKLLQFVTVDRFETEMRDLKSYVGVQVESLRSDFRAGLELAMHQTSLINNREVRIQKLEKTVTF